MKKNLLFTTILVSLFSFAGCKAGAEVAEDFTPTKTLSGYFLTSYDMYFRYVQDDYYLNGSFVFGGTDFYKNQSVQDGNEVPVFFVYEDEHYSLVENYSPIYESIGQDHELYSVNEETESSYEFVLSTKECTVFKCNDQINGYIVKGINDRLIFFPEQECGMPYECQRKDISYKDVSGVIYKYNDKRQTFTEVPYWGIMTVNGTSYYCIYAGK